MFIIFPSKRSVSLVYFIVKSANKVYMTLVFLPYFGADAVLLAYLEWAFYQNSRKPSYILSWFVPFESLPGQKPRGPRGWSASQERAEARWATHFTLKKCLALEFDSFCTIFSAQISWASDSKCKIGSFLELEIWLNLNICYIKWAKYLESQQCPLEIANAFFVSEQLFAIRSGWWVKGKAAIKQRWPLRFYGALQSCEHHQW